MIDVSQGTAQKSTVRRRAVLLTRQRIVGGTNGSARYVLSLARALTKSGYDVDLLGVSPKLFGRWPVLRLRPEMGLFNQIRIRGAVRIGSWFWCLNPRVYLSAILAGVERMTTKLGLSARAWLRPAETSIRAANERVDMLFVGKYGRGADLLVCDYAFLAPLAPYALSPHAPVLIIMHDLMSANAGAVTEDRGFEEERHALDAETEFALLAQADAVLAIQPEEAEAVRARLPQVTTLLAPCAIESVSEPQSGEQDVLFVGSNTYFNGQGIEWFLSECWGPIRAQLPNAQLKIAGSICRRLTDLPLGATALGVVPDLARLYAEAGVVVVPLLGGAGLKIKLVEALAAGKAVVATGAAVKGVEHLVSSAVEIADDPSRFADAVVRLLGSRDRRNAAAEAALAVAERHFSEAACYAPLRAWLGQTIVTAAEPLAAPQTVA